MKRTSETLRTIGRALYGSHYQHQAADALGVAVRTWQRWESGAFNPPAGIWAELAALCRSRGADLEALAVSLTEHHGSGQSQ